MATPGDIDRQINEKKETAGVTVSETSPKQKNLPPPFIIYSETNEECVIDDDEIAGIDKTGSESAEGAKKSKRRNRRNRHRNKRGIRQELENLDSLVLPEGVILVEEGTYIGFQCTYCNCVMSSLKTVEEHTGGNQHKQKLRSKASKGEATVSDTGSLLQPMPSLVPKENISSSEALPSTVPAVPNRETSVLLSKSSLNKYLLKTKEPIVGLDHIIEVQLPDTPPTYRCNLCILDCDSDGIKEHITGTRHRLSYLRIMDTQKIAEMLALNLKKPERNKRTIKYTEELEAMYGSGTVQVTDTPLPPITVAIQTETKASAQPQAAIQPGNNSPITIWSEPEPLNISQDNQSFVRGLPQKRPNEGEYPPWKRQSMGRDFQDRKRYNSRRQQGNYFDRRPSTYHDRKSIYPDQYQAGRSMNREQYGNKPYERSDRHVDREHNREQDGNKPQERTDQPIDREGNRKQVGNLPYEKSDQHVDRESNVEQYGNRQLQRNNQHIGREPNKERSESWRSYSDERHNDSIASKPQNDPHTISPSKQEQQLSAQYNSGHFSGNLQQLYGGETLQENNQPISLAHFNYLLGIIKTMWSAVLLQAPPNLIYEAVALEETAMEKWKSAHTAVFQHREQQTQEQAKDKVPAYVVTQFPVIQPEPFIVPITSSYSGQLLLPPQSVSVAQQSKTSPNYAEMVTTEEAQIEIDPKKIKLKERKKKKRKWWKINKRGTAAKI